eukprot:1161194-Pelagomonas_calceolata.AAC.4
MGPIGGGAWGWDPPSKGLQWLGYLRCDSGFEGDVPGPRGPCSRYARASLLHATISPCQPLSNIMSNKLWNVEMKTPDHYLGLRLEKGLQLHPSSRTIFITCARKEKKIT